MLKEKIATVKVALSNLINNVCCERRLAGCRMTTQPNAFGRIVNAVLPVLISRG